MRLLFGLLITLLLASGVQAQRTCPPATTAPLIANAAPDALSPLSALRIHLLTRRAWELAAVFEYDAGLADINRVLALRPDDPALYVLRGQMTLLLYEWDRALADFEQALALDATYAPAYWQRGLLYYTLAQREPALADLRCFVTLNPLGVQAVAAHNTIRAIESELAALNP